MATAVPIDRARIAGFCRLYGVRELSLFGSAIRSDFGPESDVDVLVEFQPEVQPSLFRIVDMQDELSKVFGRRVDLVTQRSLSRHLRDEVLLNREVLYAAQIRHDVSAAHC